MKELATRAASGAVYVALVIGAVWLGPWATWFLFLVALMLAVKEWHALHWRGSREAFPKGVILLAAWLAYMAFAPWWLHHDRGAIMGVALLAAAAGFIAIGAARSHARSRALRFAILSLAWLALPMACAPLLVALDPLLFIGLMLLVWTNDTGAYLVGRLIGRRKLMPAVSPAKTWEGFVGGAVLTLLAAWFWAPRCPSLGGAVWMMAGAAVSIAATAGDLFESWLKRRAGVKDSGRLMPGHGGVLDRFDGYLFAAPI
ncbi:MAG: phosphatidate cytidylyltransferase, partial [Flavobacteriales bacterium]